MNIYLDNNATTSLDPLVLEAMLPELAAEPSNPSSIHSYGQEAKWRLQRAREGIAHYLGAKREEILFTSGGTESMNMLIRGLLYDKRGGHVITSDVEHSCVYNTLKEMEKEGWKVSFLEAGLLGAVQPEAIKAEIGPSTCLIVLAAVNAETGVKHDIETIAAIAQEAHIPFAIDAVAWMGKEPLFIPPGVTGMGVSGHKFHGPKGTGFAFLRSHALLHPQMTGGDQEYGKRAGTENLPGIVGLAKAVSLLEDVLPKASHRMAQLRDRLEAGLLQHCNPAVVNGMGPRVANVCNLAFPGVNGEDLLIALDMQGIAVSHGSACSSGALEPSRVLTHMGVPPEIARASMRFSLSRLTTEEEIDHCIKTTAAIVQQLRGEVT